MRYVEYVGRHVPWATSQTSACLERLTIRIEEAHRRISGA
jgi:hypothetical protein